VRRIVPHRDAGRDIHHRDAETQRKIKDKDDVKLSCRRVFLEDAEGAESAETANAPFGHGPATTARSDSFGRCGGGIFPTETQRHRGKPKTGTT
jgi:hypothetical protein